MLEIESVRDPAYGHKKVGFLELKTLTFQFVNLQAEMLGLVKLRTHFRQVSDPHAMQANIREKYPSNPNGSISGVTGLSSVDGRFTIMMPHPERVFRSVQNSWHPEQWEEDGAWMYMFRNARYWVG